jgi:ubiquinone/menaquinone biosynthesis C-methylase UbiE
MKVPDGFQWIAGLLACPYCRSELTGGEAGFDCRSCGKAFGMHGGIALLAREGVADSWAADSKTGESSKPYQEEYRRVEEAAVYNAAYRDRLFKRASTNREFALLRGLLATQGRTDILLNLPAGGGRLSAPLAETTAFLVEADIALGQLVYSQQNSHIPVPHAYMTASGFHIPFKDRSVDGVVCIRLCHHLPTEEERERLITELLRVARRFVIMTFFDFHSVKNLLRRMTRPLNHKPPKMTMTVRQVSQVAARCGARLMAYPRLSIVGSGHRYALMVKEKEQSNA